MDYRSTTKIRLTFILAFCLTSCGVGEKKQHPDVDSFYTQIRYGQQFSLVPLVKPLTLSCDMDNKNWGFHPSSIYNGFSLYNWDGNSIGVQDQYIYGRTMPYENENDKVLPNETVYAYNRGGSTWSSEPEKSDSYAKAKTVTGKPNTYIMPERWFIIDTEEEKGEGFFNKADYLKSLKSKGIEGKMYKSDSLLKEYRETGVLEYFPDSVKTKLRK